MEDRSFVLSPGGKPPFQGSFERAIGCKEKSSRTMAHTLTDTRVSYHKIIDRRTKLSGTRTGRPTYTKFNLLSFFDIAIGLKREIKPK